MTNEKELVNNHILPKFENKDMQVYYEKITKMETIDIDFLIMEKKVKLDHARNINSLMVVCFVSFFVFGLPKFLLDGINIFENIFAYFIYFLIALVGLFIGDYMYGRTVGKILYEIEILNYLKEAKFFEKM